jgi:hypothetical protein
VAGAIFDQQTWRPVQLFTAGPELRSAKTKLERVGNVLKSSSMNLQRKCVVRGRAKGNCGRARVYSGNLMRRFDRCSGVGTALNQKGTKKGVKHPEWSLKRETSAIANKTWRTHRRQRELWPRAIRTAMESLKWNAAGAPGYFFSGARVTRDASEPVDVSLHGTRAGTLLAFRRFSAVRRPRDGYARAKAKKHTLVTRLGVPAQL